MYAVLRNRPYKQSIKEVVVTLEGKARNASEKDLVTKFAQDVYGVNNVVNNMTITEPGI